MRFTAGSERAVFWPTPFSTCCISPTRNGSALWICCPPRRPRREFGCSTRRREIPVSFSRTTSKDWDTSNGAAVMSLSWSPFSSWWRWVARSSRIRQRALQSEEASQQLSCSRSCSAAASGLSRQLLFQTNDFPRRSRRTVTVVISALPSYAIQGSYPHQSDAPVRRNAHSFSRRSTLGVACSVELVRGISAVPGNYRNSP